MLIYFVRHGHPDYENDSLTEIGTLQAEAAAKRLANSGIQEVYSSPGAEPIKQLSMCTIENGVYVVSAYSYSHGTMILAPNGKVLDEAAVMVARLQKWV